MEGPGEPNFFGNRDRIRRTDVRRILKLSGNLSLGRGRQETVFRTSGTRCRRPTQPTSIQPVAQNAKERVSVGKAAAQCRRSAGTRAAIYFGLSIGSSSGAPPENIFAAS